MERWAHGFALILALGAAPACGDGSTAPPCDDPSCLAASCGDGVIDVGQFCFSRTATYETDLRVGGMALEDLDGDGDVDLAYAIGDFVGIRLNDGAGGLGAEQRIDAQNPATTTDVVAADLDNDADFDLVTAGLVSVLTNDGAGHFTLAGVESTEARTGVAAGDLNADGSVDLVTLDRGGGQAWVQLNDGAGVLGTPAAFPAGLAPNAIALADLDRDQDLDVLVASYGAVVGGHDETIDDVTVLLNDGLAVLSTTRSFPGIDTAVGMALLDLDADRNLDVVLVNETPDVAVIRNAGLAGFEAPVTVTHAVAVDAVAASDLDNDGDPDLALGLGAILNGGPDGFMAAPGYPEVDDALEVGVADLDGDGASDIVVGHFLAGITVVFANP